MSEAATSPITWTVDTYSLEPGEGAHGYVDLHVAGVEVGCVSITRYCGSRTWETLAHDDMPEIGVEDGDLLDVAPSSRPETLARRIVAEAEAVRAGAGGGEPKADAQPAAYAAILQRMSDEVRAAGQAAEVRDDLDADHPPTVDAHRAADLKAEAARDRGDMAAYQRHAAEAGRIADRSEWDADDHRVARQVVRHWPESDEAYESRQHDAVERSRAARDRAVADSAKRRAVLAGCYAPAAGEAA